MRPFTIIFKSCVQVIYDRKRETAPKETVSSPDELGFETLIQSHTRAPLKLNEHLLEGAH